MNGYGETSIYRFQNGGFLRYLGPRCDVWSPASMVVGTLGHLKKKFVSYANAEKKMTQPPSFFLFFPPHFILFTNHYIRIILNIK